ncbi:hypothetical protein GCM10011521_16420 [Arenimonas soli]|uniref:Uncharacterized protein n=1 Tax=Arenimonas soli TaxID=2269504 RepID=A0ABQ1HJ62_9GAMM|nr:hypothetical protein [Arenimonas soli]GGA78926.1 hypothetical protein GCM10011521_16420 [Arenimonas soli]
MKSWKRPLIESVLVGSALALAVIFVARQQMYGVLDWIGPAFYLPFRGAALLSGNTEEPAAWLFHGIMFLQFFLLAFAVGWLAGRYRSRQPNAI